MLGIIIRVSLELLLVLIRNCGGSQQHLFENSRNRSAIQGFVDLNVPVGSLVTTDTVPRAQSPEFTTMPQGLVEDGALSWL